MQEQELIPHLFRTEYGKITAVLCKLLGIAHMESAEDIAAETFLSALERWPYNGMPANPVAWLYVVAKNKAKNHIARNKIFQNKIEQDIKAQVPGSEEIDIDLSETNISDSQLQMLFAVCHPCIPAEGQVALALRVLCGFGIEEIANAFLTSKETINKRLSRAKEKLRNEQVAIALPPQAEIKNRLENVLLTLYLLFNEGYYSESSDTVLRDDLCLEAMRLCYLLLYNEQTALPAVHALFALMCFHASRFAARKDANGAIVLYDDQDENLWNKELIAKGAYHLHEASQGTDVTKYHLEANIAYWHTIKEDTNEKWERILQLYNHLLQIEYSPIAALNRTYALSKANGKTEAIKEAEQLQLTGNPYYFTLLGALYSDTDKIKALGNYEKAYELAKTQADRYLIRQKMDKL